MRFSFNNSKNNQYLQFAVCDLMSGYLEILIARYELTLGVWDAGRLLRAGTRIIPAKACAALLKSVSFS
jgi:hypothetical protein